jgi:protein involved in polysaccharide export with SLBB domain
MMKDRGYIKVGKPLKRNFLFLSVFVILVLMNVSFAQERRVPSRVPASAFGYQGVRPEIPAEALEAIQGKEKEEPLQKVPLEDRVPFPWSISATPGDTFVDLSWTPLETIRLEEPQIEEKVGGYIVFYGTESGDYTERIDVGDVSRYRIRNLENYTPYFFALKAYTDTNKLTPFSTEVKAIPKPKEALKSAIERIFSEELPQTISKELEQFGYELFRTTVSTFAPVTDVPVGPDYVIGPGDRFSISTWGRLERSYQVEVDRNGEITIPKIGTLKVWGLTFAELKTYLVREFSQHYKGFHMNVAMGKLRTIRVYVVGDVATPGSYSLSSLSTVYNALFAAGGPSKRGSMRNIQLIRNGKAIQSVDLYHFLLRGDKSQDARLQSGDTIFVPIIGPVVGIAGNVMRPAIYEIKDTLTLGELFDLAGGVTSAGYLQRVQIERIVAHEKKIVEDFDLSGYAKKRDYPQLAVALKDRDLVKVLPIYPETRDVVYLEGHVKRPGGYEFREGMRLLDLVPSFDILLPEPYLQYADITRLVPPDFHPETIPFNLERLLKGDKSQNIVLKEFDEVTIYSRDTLRELPQVTISGEVQDPGKYRLLENMKVKDLIYDAGNLKRSAYLPEAEITRLIKTEEGVESKVLTINLGKALDENPVHNIPLKEDDYVFVRQIPEWYTDKTVSLEGEVVFPGVYSFSKGETLSSVLQRAGGYTDRAYLKGAVFTRESAREKQQERLKGYIDRLEEDILRAQAQIAEATISEAEAKSLEQSLGVKKELLRKTKAARATGRVVIVLEPLVEFKGSKYDMELEDGDALTIPPVPGVVNVLGSVYNPTSIVYTRGKTVDFYLNKVGGPTPDAEEKEIYLIKADGTVISRTQEHAFGIAWDSEANRWASGSFMAALVEPGDTVLVPSKVTRFVWKRELMDWTTILYQIAVTAGVVVAAF